MDKKSGAFIGGLYRMAGRGDEVDLLPDSLLKVRWLHAIVLASCAYVRAFSSFRSRTMCTWPTLWR